MNLGSKILELRRQKNVTQEELAAELGVTAAAVSKWENGYTLPDILMLCALADYFAVTTDALLGRAKNWKYAVIAARTMDLGEKIRKLALNYGISAKAVYTSYEEALAQVEQDISITVMLISVEHALSENELHVGRTGVSKINVNCDTEQETLDGFAMYLQYMATIPSLNAAKNN